MSKLFSGCAGNTCLASTISDSPLTPKAAASGLCNPSSTMTATPTFGNAARPRRLRALRICFLTWGVLVTENKLPSTPHSRSP